jgi:hypothetical protein
MERMNQRLEDCLEQLKLLRSFWSMKIGGYENTSMGLDSTEAPIGGTFKEINERRARKNVRRYQGLIEWIESGKFLKGETMDGIKHEYDLMLKKGK